MRKPDTVSVCEGGDLAYPLAVRLPSKPLSSSLSAMLGYQPRCAFSACVLRCKGGGRCQHWRMAKEMEPLMVREMLNGSEHVQLLPRAPASFPAT